MIANLIVRFRAAGAAALLALAAASCGQPPPPESVIGGPFSLINQDGERVTEADFLGQPMLVYFGFTYCPDVCPLALQTLAIGLEQLGDDAGQFQTVLVTIDPERDTPEQMASYVASNGFPGNLTGLTGTPEEIRAAADAYRVYYARIDADESSADYLMEHTSVIYLMDDEGRFVEPFGHGSAPDDIAATLRRYLDEH